MVNYLYYYHVNGTLFSSGSNLKSGIIKTGLNINSIAKYLQYAYIPSPQTAFDNIFKLGAGNRLKFDSSGLKKKNGMI